MLVPENDNWVPKIETIKGEKGYFLHGVPTQLFWEPNFP